MCSLRNSSFWLEEVCCRSLMYSLWLMIASDAIIQLWLGLGCSARRSGLGFVPYQPWRRFFEQWKRKRPKNKWSWYVLPGNRTACSVLYYYMRMSLTSSSLCTLCRLLRQRHKCVCVCVTSIARRPEDQRNSSIWRKSYAASSKASSEASFKQMGLRWWLRIYDLWLKEQVKATRRVQKNRNT